jgi:site-specific recombinase XerD
MLNKLAEKSNVEHVHPHKFRRTLATNLNRRGMPIQEVANLLGHEKLDTTMKYVVLNDEDLKHDYRKYTV